MEAGTPGHQAEPGPSVSRILEAEKQTAGMQRGKGRGGDGLQRFGPQGVYHSARV